MDREACADYKELLDPFLPPEYSELAQEIVEDLEAALEQFREIALT